MSDVSGVWVPGVVRCYCRGVILCYCQVCREAMPKPVLAPDVLARYREARGL